MRIHFSGKCTLGLLALVASLLVAPSAALADETDSPNDNLEGIEAEYDRGTGAYAESWRFTEGYLDSDLEELYEGEPAVSPYGAYDDLTGDQAITARDTWTKSNGVKTYTYRKNPTDPDTIIQVPDSLAVGIDVSEHNNAPGGKAAGPIDWQKVKDDGISFAIIRCGYGSDFTLQDDKWFASNYKGAKAAGLKVGVYLYSYATKVLGNDSAAESEAKHVLRVLRENGINPTDLALPIYLDLEDKSQEGLSRSQIGQMARTFCDTIKNAGYKVGIYANQNWYKNVLTDPVFSAENMKAAKWSRWVARYSYGDSTPGVENADFWQFTDIGIVSGTPKKYCDVNFMLSSEFAGSRWEQQNGQWYLLDAKSEKLYGWQTIGGKWYYLDSGQDGAMRTGWLRLSGAWYYLKANGEMATGWQKAAGKWYFLNGSGVMQTGWLKDAGRWYYLIPETGAMRTGWLQLGRAWYYLYDTGIMAEGWAKVEGAWYYLSPGSGPMVTGWQKISGQWYFLDSSGAMARNAWVGDYYLEDSGAMATSKWIGRYHVNASGRWDKTR